MTGSWKVLLFLLSSGVLWLPAVLWPQEPVSALPPPVTRGLYRSHWFEFLNAHLEDDARGAAKALSDMKKAARRVGVARLSDFSRTAVHEAHKAEAQGRLDRAARAHEAAILLDDANYDAVVSRLAFLVRRGSYGEAMRLIPAAGAALLATRESRLALFSSLALWGALALGAAVLGSVIVFLFRHWARFAHDLREIANRSFGGRAYLPMALLLLALPLALGFGPVWILLFWGVLVFPYAERPERVLLFVGFVVLGFLVPMLGVVSRNNIVERSPLYLAAADLEERREDASAVDGLRQASVVFAEDPDVWFLLGIYAERSGDNERALADYDRAIRAGPEDYRPYLNRGNVYFQEGEFKGAIRDYETAAERNPQAAEVFYNLSIARGEAYDFDGQAAAMARARQISGKDVSRWTEQPTLNRVVAATYPLSRARKKVEQWNAQSKSRRLPGHALPVRPLDIFLSPFTLGPWAAGLFAVAVARWRSQRVLSQECVRCGRPFCRMCKNWGEPPLYCNACVRLHIRKEAAGIEAHVSQAREVRERTKQRDRACRLAALLLPGTHRYFSGRPFAGFFLLLLFFLCVAIAWIGGSFFEPRQLPPPGPWRASFYVALAAAAGIWVFSLAESWRKSHGA